MLHFLGCIESFKHQAILTTCYAAGLRISETTRLKPEAIDRQRIRVEQGKGQKDRYVMLSARLLEVLSHRCRWCLWCLHRRRHHRRPRMSQQHHLHHR